MGKKFISNIDVNNNKIINLGNPTDQLDGVNKDYLDESNVDFHQIYNYNFSNNTNGVPSSGEFTTNSTTTTSVTQLKINNNDLINFIIDDSIINTDNFSKQLIKIQESGDNNSYYLFEIQSYTQQTGYYDLNGQVTKVSVNGGTPTVTNDCKVIFLNSYTFDGTSTTYSLNSGFVPDDGVLGSGNRILLDNGNWENISNITIDNHSQLNLDDGTNPHGTTKTDVGLGNVDNVQQYPNSNPSGFETPAQLDTRDVANRDRVNHTGTQLANTISDFDNTVENNTEVSQNTIHRDLTNNPHNVTPTQIGLGNAVTGTGTTNYVSKWSSSSEQTDSQIFDNGTSVGIGTILPTEKLDIDGTLRVRDISNGIGNFVTKNVDGVLTERTATQVLSDIGAQGTITNPVTGTGTTNYVSKWSSSSEQTDSQIFDNGTNVGIGTILPIKKVDILGDVQIENTVSGATVFNILGTSGQLFSVTDNLIGDIFSVNDISGIPILTVNSDDRVIVDGIIETNSSIFSSLSTGTHTVAEFDETLGSAAYFDYYVTDGSTIFRSGTVMAVWNGTNTEYTETSTKDLGGSTDPVTFSVDLSGGNVRLRSTVASGTWTIKTGIRII